jgi:hypothetical protein
VLKNRNKPWKPPGRCSMIPRSALGTAAHRQRSRGYARCRSRWWPALILRKGVKSLQSWVNEAIGQLGGSPVSASAFSKACYRLQHTAFIEPNRQAVVESLYGDGGYRRYRGYRLLGVDGSKVLLPDSETVREQFGTIAYSNGQHGEGAVAGERPYALASTLYDLCNHVALDARLGRAKCLRGRSGCGASGACPPGRPGVGRSQLSVLSHARRAEPARDRLRHLLFQPIVQPGARDAPRRGS